MERYRIRRMAERLALKISRSLAQDRFEQDLWNLAAIIEEHLFSELGQLEEMRDAERGMRNTGYKLRVASSAESNDSRPNL
jgi:hypothetical protein